MDISIEFIQSIGLFLAALMGVSLLIAVILLVILLLTVRRIDVPEGAGFSETLLYTPLLVVVFIDILDLALDVLAAPVAWVVLDRLGLRALRAVSAFEALLPFTQLIPTMTLAWFAARLIGPRLDVIEPGKFTRY